MEPSFKKQIKHIDEMIDDIKKTEHDSSRNGMI